MLTTCNQIQLCKNKHTLNASQLHFINESKFRYGIDSIVIQTQNLKWTLKNEHKYGQGILLPKWWEKYKDSLIQIRSLTRWYENYKDSHIQTRALT